MGLPFDNTVGIAESGKTMPLLGDLSTVYFNTNWGKSNAFEKNSGHHETLELLHKNKFKKVCGYWEFYPG